MRNKRNEVHNATVPTTDPWEMITGLQSISAWVLFVKEFYQTHRNEPKNQNLAEKTNTPVKPEATEKICNLITTPPYSTCLLLGLPSVVNFVIDELNIYWLPHSSLCIIMGVNSFEPNLSFSFADKNHHFFFITPRKIEIEEV